MGLEPTLMPAHTPRQPGQTSITVSLHCITAPVMSENEYKIHCIRCFERLSKSLSFGLREPRAGASAGAGAKRHHG